MDAMTVYSLLTVWAVLTVPMGGLSVQEEYILGLIRRMNTEETFADSSKTTSWKAYREAENLSDPALYSVLEELLRQNARPEGKKIRKAAYFVFGKLLKNTPQEEAIQFYLGQLELERDKYILSDMLDRISELTLPPNISVCVIARLAMQKTWQVRHSAIRALGASSAPESRQVLRHYIGQEDIKAYRYEIIYANAALGRIGQAEDIPCLERHVGSRARDVRDSAAFAIGQIQARLK